MKHKKFISADDSLLNYMGRIDIKNKSEPAFYYTGSYVKFHFSGNSLCIIIKNKCIWNNAYFGYFIDGKEGIIKAEDSTDKVEYSIEIETNKSEHEFILFKRQDGSHYYSFCGFYIDNYAEIIRQQPMTQRKIECYGDSVCCGTLCELMDFSGKNDPDDIEKGAYDNSWYAFPMITARLLDAQINNVSQGGIALLDGTGWYHSPNYIGMESVYNKLCYFPEGGILSEWDFSCYIPDIVIIAIGQNDIYLDGYPQNNISNQDYRLKWKNKYINIIKQLMGKYPSAEFILLTTIMIHDSKWDNAIDEVENEIYSDKIHRFYFRRNGTAATGHPRINEQEEMACELTEYIKTLRIFN